MSDAAENTDHTGPPALVDIGANLTDKSFRTDRDLVVDRALAAGVRAMVITGTSVSGSRAAADLAAELSACRPGVLYATAGVHPHEASSFDEHTAPALAGLCALPQVVAVGECGLDYNRDFSPRPDQRRALHAQLELAAELCMPVFLHERDAGEDMLAMLREHRSRLPAAVVHCFTGDAATLDGYLALDLHIGITGWICDERRGQGLLELVPRIPPERLMLETDAPYLLPRTIRPRPKSRRNEPAHLVYVLDQVARCTGRDRAEVARASTATARSFFGLPALS
jgi:TatD DNase family protein